MVINLREQRLLRRLLVLHAGASYKGALPLRREFYRSPNKRIEAAQQNSQTVSSAFKEL